VRERVEKGLRGVENEFGGMRKKNEVEKVDIAVSRLERKKEKAGVHPA
jgi:hypothetical protein